MGLAYRPEIDGLRAIAVGSVIAFHAGATATAGFVGVDVFFVISGYLISSLLLHELDMTGKIKFREFYARRARRILPASLLVIGASLAAALLLLDFRQQVSAAESAVAASLFLANLFFQANTGGYFQESAELMPLLHYWSLSVEEQFYLAWPVLLMILPKRRLAAAMALIALASFLVAEWIDSKDAFFNTFCRAWELAAGGIVATVAPRRLPAWVIWVGLLILVDACLVPFGMVPGIGALPAVVGTTITLAAIHGGSTNAWLSWRPLVGIGKISYSLYLWHWPLLVYLRVMGGDSRLDVLGACSVALVLAVGSYRYVEQPFRRRSWTTSDWRSLTAGAAAMVIVVIAGMAVRASALATPQAIAAYDRPVGTCHNEMPDADCATATGPVTVAIWGDSMAYSWQPLASELALRQRVAALSFSADGCKPALGFENPARPHCSAWARRVLDRVRSLDTVILAGRWDFEFYERDPIGAEAGLRATMDQLGAVRKVLILGPLPVLRAKAYQCLEGNDLARCSVRTVDFMRDSAAARRSLKSIVRDYPNSEYVEVSDWFCSESFCPAIRHGRVLYYDSFHVSKSAAASFARQFSPQ